MNNTKRRKMSEEEKTKLLNRLYPGKSREYQEKKFEAFRQRMLSGGI